MLVYLTMDIFEEKLNKFIDDKRKIVHAEMASKPKKSYKNISSEISEKDTNYNARQKDNN